MVIERRRARRLKVNLPIRIDYPGSPKIYSQTENISILGTYVRADHQIPLGTKLSITIEIPPYTDDLSLTGNVMCRGDVFRCDFVKEMDLKRFYGLGIFFVDFSDEKDKDKLSKYIDFLMLKEKEDIKKALRLWRKRRRKRLT